MLQIIISSIFYVTFVLYIFMGIYSLALNRKATLNRIFFFVCISFSIWAFAFAMCNISKTFEEAVIWRRISSLGWGVSYSMILHSALALTERKNILRNRRVYAALYVPAVYNVYYYAISGSAKYQLEHTVSGWASIPLNDFGDIFFNGYYSLFTFLTLMLIFRWYFTTKDEIKRKHAIYLFISFSVTFLLGTLTDVLANRFLTFKIPSLAPIIILIPIVTIFHIIRKYGLMVPIEKQRTYQEGAILSSDNRAVLFRYISLVIVIGCVINISVSFIYSKELILGGLLNVFVVLCGAFMFVITTIIQSPKHQDNVLFVLLTAIMIVMMFIYYDKSISNIVWPVPLFFIILTIIFNNKKMLVIIASASLLIELVTWSRIPELKIRIAAGDYTFRIVFYILGIVLTAYINKIYISRLKENEKHAQFQEMISSISTSLVTVTGNNFDEKIMELLAKSSNYTYADRSYIGMFYEDQKKVRFTHEWLGEEMPPVAEGAKKLHSASFKWWSEQLLKNKIVFVPSIETLPSEAEAERELMLSRGIKNLILIPISNKEKVVGFIGFDKIMSLKAWRIEDNELLRVLANLTADAMTKVEVEKEMKYLAYYDGLTGLANRTLFNNRIEQAINLARRNGKLVGVIFLDLDGFKGVNDTLGHDWGDNLLKQVGERLTNCIRKYDTVARFGGDEFLIMIPQISQIENIETVAKKIMEAFRKPILINEQEFFITASLGISVFPYDGEDGNTLIKNADLAMYHGKNNGKNQFAFCSTKMKDNVLKKMTLTNSLYRALEREELVLNYQPQVSIKTGEIIGMEALIRWDHPELGRIPPFEFIPIAEQTGLINSIGEWILKTACRQNKAWQDMGLKPVRLAVNISVEQFRSGSMLNIVKECLEETGLEARYLELEITEGIAMKEAQYIVKALQELKALGIEISIDDFGMEYSSLSRLKDLPVNRLKMDMQFIRGIAVSSKSESIIKVIINLAKSLGLKVIAEGVENEVQLNFLAQQECDEVQGYYYFKPMTKEEVQRILTKLS